MIIFISDIAVSEGDNITLNCTLNGSNINWTIPRSNETKFGQLLEIPLIKRNAAGIYKCRNVTLAEEEHNVTVQCKCACLPLFVTVGQTDRPASLVVTLHPKFKAQIERK